ncbi:MAG: class I SAM-dependent methyltransferase [Pseudomonadota bacterium]
MPLIPRGVGPVLDLACGEGRHIRPLLINGYQVVGVDKRMVGLADVLGEPALSLVQRDLEDGSDWPFDPDQFAGIVVTNYLYRPLLPILAAALAPGGVLIYETFMDGHQQFGQPSNPDYLLQPHELLTAFMGPLEVVAFEQGEVSHPRQAMVQRLVARRPDTGTYARGAPHPIIPSR